MNESILQRPIEEVYREYPFLTDFFLSCALEPPSLGERQSLAQWFAQLEYFTLDEVGLEREKLPQQLAMFMDKMCERMQTERIDVESVTIIGGHDKNGQPECETLTLRRGDVVSIVGPTGSGKSRLLADIEWLAQGDTPTGRRILINGETPPAGWRFSIERKLVAQLSQNMNFVMDITVGDFLRVHCESRMIQNAQAKIDQIIEASNRLAGEPIAAQTPVAALSGGQSRALMIADTAYMSASPIVLIDEIENAGINRKTAIDLLVRAEKIVLMATHDPVLALQANRRVVIKNGGISRILQTTQQEKEELVRLERMNDVLMQCRELLRNGGEVTTERADSLFYINSFKEEV